MVSNTLSTLAGPLLLGTHLVRRMRHTLQGIFYRQYTNPLSHSVVDKRSNPSANLQLAQFGKQWLDSFIVNEVHVAAMAWLGTGLFQKLFT